jgi:hypothetical protein
MAALTGAAVRVSELAPAQVGEADLYGGAAFPFR